MLFKLSFKNIKKSVKDYSIYFFTLIFAVAMFYMFNSLDSQSSMLIISESKKDIVKSLVGILSYVSIFVSVILGFLIIYSNKFLIKRRKKEIGLYFTLGMSKRKVSIILVLETLLIGLISLAIGLVVGIGLSQFVSIFTAKLFEANMTELNFVFSQSALNKTILYFGIIFLLVIIFNVVSLSKYKLIDLLHANKKNEKVKIKNKYITILTFILSVILLGYAYYLLWDNVLVMMDYKTIVMLACGALGTFLLFFSLSGFILKIVQKIKKVFYKDLNIFTLNQINNKINTTVISTTIISLMLLLTIGILSSSISMANAFNNDIQKNNLTDFTAMMDSEIGYYNKEHEIEIVSNEETFNKFKNIINDDKLAKFTTNYVLLHRYIDESLTFDKMITKKDIDILKKEYGSALSLQGNPTIITESEYNKLAKIQKLKTYNIKDNEYILMCNIKFVSDSYKAFYEKKYGIDINNKHLTPATDKIVNVPIQNSNSAGNDGVIVVNDNLVQGLQMDQMDMIGNYNSNIDIENIDDDFKQYIYNNYGEVDLRTGESMRNANIGIKSMMTFVGLYLGITFAISSATILAIGQLSESSDNKERYNILKRLGADNKMINKALFTQILIIFIFPLIVALIHSYFGLKEINSLIIAFGNIDLTSNIILTTLFMIIVYGGYFILTYLCSKSIIKD